MFFLKNCDKKFILDAFLEVLIGKDENFNILTLRKVYLTKGQKKNNNNVHTCRTVRDTLSRSKTARINNPRNYAFFKSTFDITNASYL